MSSRRSIHSSVNDCLWPPAPRCICTIEPPDYGRQKRLRYTIVKGQPFTVVLIWRYDWTPVSVPFPLLHSEPVLEVSFMVPCEQTHPTWSLRLGQRRHPAVTILRALALRIAFWPPDLRLSSRTPIQVDQHVQRTHRSSARGGGCFSRAPFEQDRFCQLCISLDRIFDWMYTKSISIASRFIMLLVDLL